MRRLVLVRHGETVGNSSVRYHGRGDVALSELGQAQMRAAARWLRAKLQRNGFAPVFTSPLIRAREDAHLIGGPQATPIQIDEFAEVDFGRFEGLTLEEIRDRYPADFIHWRRDPLSPDYTYPGGESRSAFAARVMRGIERMLPILETAPAPYDALLVAHRGVIRTIAEYLSGAAPEIGLGSIHLLRAGTGIDRWEAELLDVTEHLEPL
ncbi:MAG TPA: histidine phosphatase family protein [Candidatus Binataceae bacterium]|nr:histidine phosphatase family protein [Candidatus Binataceae bacterium]